MQTYHTYCHKKSLPNFSKNPKVGILNLNSVYINILVLCFLQVAELQINLNDISDSQAGRVVEDHDDDVADFEGVPEDTDEEYVPTAESSSFSASTSAACKRKAQCKTDRAENGEAADDDSKKDSVQCPVCDKTFKSKYYLKVHNR